MKNTKIASMLRFLGYSQIIATVFLIIAAYNVEPGFVKIGRQLSKVVILFNKVIPEYKDLFNDTSQNIVNQEKNLVIAALAIDDIGQKLTIAGGSLEAKRGKFYYPDKLADVGKDLKIYGNTVFSVGAGIKEQIEILQRYKNVVLPQTLEIFNQVTELGKSAEITASNVTTGSHTALIITLLICGLLFLLNGIGLICIAKFLNITNETEKR